MERLKNNPRRCVMNCMERREELNQRACWFFSQKVSTCPRCGSGLDIEKIDGNEVTLNYCGWCNSQWKVQIKVLELKEQDSMEV